MWMTKHFTPEGEGLSLIVTVPLTKKEAETEIHKNEIWMIQIGNMDKKTLRVNDEIPQACSCYISKLLCAEVKPDMAEC